MEDNVLFERTIVKQTSFFKNAMKKSKAEFSNDYIPLGSDLQNNGCVWLSVPYCGSTIEFLLIYSSHCLLPDVVWPAQYSDYQPVEINFEEILSECEEQRLFSLIWNIMKDFPQYQMDKILPDSDVKEQIRQCLEFEAFNITRFELLYVNHKQRGKSCKDPIISFHVDIELDSSDLPAKIITDNKDDFVIHFETSFDSYTLKSISNKSDELTVILPAYIKNIFTTKSIVTSKACIKEQGLSSALFNCLQEIKESLTILNDNVSKRESFLASLLSVLASHTLEFDSVDYFKAAFLIEHNDFYCILEVHLDSTFPRTPPGLYLRSVYYSDSGDGGNAVRTQIPLLYSANMGTPDLISRIITKLPEAINDFKAKR